MALSGTINGSVTKNSNHFSFYATWSATQNVEGNYSDVTVRSYWKCVNTSYYTFDTVGTRAASITVSTSAGTLGSETISQRFDLAPWPSNPYLIQTLTVRVQHNADGSAVPINITARANGTASSYGPSSSTSSSGDCVASDFVTLDTIPRASKPTLSATSTNLGSSVTIYTNAASSSFRHKIYYNWYSTTNGSPTWISIGQDVKDELPWTLPPTFANNLPGVTKGYGTIRCETYNGSTRIGTKDVTFEGVVPNTSDFRPKCAIEVTDPTGYAAQYGSFVKGLSTFNIKVTPTLAYGSPIARYTVLANGQSYNEAEVTTGVVAELQGTIQATVTDERSRTSTLASKPYTALDYVKPTISALTVHRCDANGAENDQGEYVRATFSAAVAPLNSLNSAKYVLRYTIMSDGSATTTETELTALAGRYQVTDYTAAPFAADGNSTYSVELAVTDDISTTTRATSVSTAFTLMNWGPEGRSMAIGKVAEKPGTLEVALDLEVQGDAALPKGATFGGSSLLNTIYPVGSIYMSTVNISPATFLGGTWEQIQDRFLLAAGSTYAAGATGGAATHKLTVSEMPSHTHSFEGNGGSLDPDPYTYVGMEGDNYQDRPSFNFGSDYTSQGYVSLATTGGGAAHNNMPPYLAVYIWKRTA